MEYIGVEDGATFESIDEMVACVSAESTFDKDTAEDEEVLQFDDTLLVDDVDYSNQVRKEPGTDEELSSSSGGSIPVTQPHETFESEIVDATVEAQPDKTGGAFYLTLAILLVLAGGIFSVVAKKFSKKKKY